jgi:collagenase-like PrtC family protease
VSTASPATLATPATPDTSARGGTWVIPYVDQGLEFWEAIRERFEGQVREVYFPVPDGRFASGRSRQPQRFLEDFLRYAPLPKGVLLNPIVLPGPVEQLMPQIHSTLRWLRDDFGVRCVTVANATLARMLKETLPDWHVTASVLMGIASPSQAWLLQQHVDAITVDNRLVRDLAALRALRSAFPGEVRMLVNEACLPGCLFRTQHFYEMGYSEDLPASLCQQMLEERPWLRLTGAWVLPRHLGYYDGLYDTLKLAGRVTLRDPARYMNVLGAYVDRAPILPRDIGGGPASPVEAIDVSDEWFGFVLHCDKRCHVCSVCQEQYGEAQRRLRGEK